MKLTLLNTHAVKLTIATIDFQKDRRSFELKRDVMFDEHEPTAFSVLFELEVFAPNFSLSGIFVSKFVTEASIDQEFRDSDFPTINAPAIAFPFVRSIVSTITLNCGLEVVILPSVNFVEMVHIGEEESETGNKVD